MTSDTQSSVEWQGQVLTIIDGPVATVTIDHADRNLLNPGVMTSLRQALVAADADQEVTGIILAGARDCFCGGLDVPAIQNGADPTEFARALVELLTVFPRLTTPVAAAVNGDAVASGASLVAACDFAAAVDGARIGTYEVSVGIWPMIAQVPLIHRIGARAAMENVGAGEPFTTERAREVGLIQRITGADDVAPTVREWLDKAARAGAAGASRRSLYELAELPYAEALRSSLARFVAQFEKPS
jgi:enoyl-CoA hydratase/carnithine racemase